MSNPEWAEKLFKECLEKIPVEERETIFQNLGKCTQSMEKGFETCCQNRCKCAEIQKD